MDNSLCITVLKFKEVYVRKLIKNKKINIELNYNKIYSFLSQVLLFPLLARLKELSSGNSSN